MQFHVWARKAPYFYDLETDTFLTNKETRMFYKIRMDQAWEERQLELSEFEKDPTITIMSEEEWEVAVENEIASEIEEINMKYQALRDASIR
jgi:hypothetical protein